MMFIAVAMFPGFGQRPVAIHPPSIATIAGITLGLTTVQKFERRHGKGLVHTGGHSNSGRYWYDARRGFRVNTDGFDYASGGELVDFVEVSWVSPSSVDRMIPRISLSVRSLGVLAHLRKGMSRGEVEKAVGPFKRTGLIRYSAPPTNKETRQFNSWVLEPEFGPHGLVGLRESCD